DPELIALLSEFFGYCLVRSTGAQSCLFLAGEGGTGKSTILAALTAMLGEENVSGVDLDEFKRSFALINTLGKLANISSDVDGIDKAAEGKLKAFVSGDVMDFEQKYERPFSARPTAKLVLATNNMPRFFDRSGGIWRRLLIVPMDTVIPTAERVAAMSDVGFWKRSGELPGILNWALAGLARLRKNGWQFTRSKASSAAVEEHRKESNPARLFLIENYAPGVGEVQSMQLYQDYRKWAQDTGHSYPLSDQVFAREVKRAFPDVEKVRQRVNGQKATVWRGIRPVDAPADRVGQGFGQGLDQPLPTLKIVS